MLVNTEITPNPNTLKFLPGKKVSDVGPVEFLKNDKNINIELAKNIFSLKGTELIFFGENFITVKKEPEIDWIDLKHNIISKISDYYSKGNEIIISKNFNKDLKENPVELNEITKKIHEVLDSKIRPAVAKDGGDIKFKSFKDGVVEVELQGSCSGCPSSTMTLKQGVQNLLCHYISEVKRVDAI